jgi:hypothetical protein
VRLWTRNFGTFSNGTPLDFPIGFRSELFQVRLGGGVPNTVSEPNTVSCQLNALEILCVRLKEPILVNWWSVKYFLPMSKKHAGVQNCIVQLYNFVTIHEKLVQIWTVSKPYKGKTIESVEIGRENVIFFGRKPDISHRIHNTIYY